RRLGRADRADELVLGHLAAALDVELLGARVELLLRARLEVVGPAAALARREPLLEQRDEVRRLLALRLLGDLLGRLHHALAARVLVARERLELGRAPVLEEPLRQRLRLALLHRGEQLLL